LEYWQEIQSYYSPSERCTQKQALRVVNQHYGSLPTAQFTPQNLELVRDAMIAGDVSLTPPRRPWSRKQVNDQIHRICAMFKWAVSKGKLPVAVYQALKTLSALRRGRTTARESEPIRPVPLEIINDIQRFVSSQVWALIQLQLLTGARGGELFRLRLKDINCADPRGIWTYSPSQHKTAHLDHDRIIYFGPRAQAVLKPFMLRPDDAYLFSPAEAEKQRREEMRAARKTPLQYGNSPGTNVKKSPKREPGDHYTKDSYCKAIHRACIRAFPVPTELSCRRVVGRHGGKSKRWETTAEWRKRLGEEKWQQLRQWMREHRWHPHQLRHTAATLIRREFGLEAAQVALGHSSALITDAVYAERDMAKVEEVMLKIG
jgi:integrase